SRFEVLRSRERFRPSQAQGEGMKKCACVVFSILLSAGYLALAADTARIQGTVRDAAGHAIAGASVKLATGATVVAQTSTDDHGQFQLQAVPGKYTYDVASRTFAAHLQKDIEIGPEGC